MSVFVLIPGAHGGGWWWRDVRSMLREAGHEVFTPSLTGLGERVHLAAGVTLETHVQDVVNLLRYEDLSDVVLLGWSYGGMPVTGAADRCPERLSRVVYGDALVPHDGEAAIDLIGLERRERILGLVGAGESFIPLGAETEMRLDPHPIATWTEPLPLRGAGARIPRTFIHCTNPPHPAIEASFARVSAESGWDIHELRAGHRAPGDEPRAVAALLDRIANSQED